MAEQRIKIEPSSPFPIENVPFGIFSTNQNPTPRVGTIVGDQVIDIRLLSEHGLFDRRDATDGEAVKSALAASTLNLFASLTSANRSVVRQQIIDLLSDPRSALFTNPSLERDAFVRVDDVKNHLPIEVRSFSDFLCSETHLANGNKITGNTIPSFFAFPVAYNSRPTSVLVSGEPIKRPKGMLRPPPSAQSTGPPTYSFAASTRFDFELEIGVIVSKPIARGQTITADQAHEHIFGFVLLNDWSARDIQFAEMSGMGPYNGKSTATTISPWVVLPEALEAARSKPSSERAQAEMASHPAHLKHAAGNGNITWSIDLEASIARHGGSPSVVCRSNLRDLYWTPGQMLAHMISSGSGASTGELIGTGTVSSPGHTDEKPTLGCLFELTDGGKKPLKLKNGSDLTWLEDNDEVIFTGWATGKGGRKIGFGEARAILLPAE